VKDYRRFAYVELMCPVSGSILRRAQQLSKESGFLEVIFASQCSSEMTTQAMRHDSIVCVVR
jgi:hypothetical protein